MLKDLASDVCTFVRLKIWKYINLEITQIFLSRCTKLCFSSLQSLSHVWLFAMPWTTARQASVSITNSWSPPKPMSVMPSNSHPLSSPSPPALNLSQHHGLFQWLGSFHQVAKVLELYSVYMGAYSIIGYSNLRLRMYLCKSHCVLRAKPHLCLVECPVTCCNKGGGSFITQVQPDSHFTLLFREEHMEQLRRKKCILYLECSFMTRVEYVRKCWEEMKKPRRNEVVKVLWTKDSNFITKAMVHSGGRHIDE